MVDEPRILVELYSPSALKSFSLFRGFGTTENMLYQLGIKESAFNGLYIPVEYYREELGTTFSNTKNIDIFAYELLPTGRVIFKNIRVNNVKVTHTETLAALPFSKVIP